VPTDFPRWNSAITALLKSGQTSVFRLRGKGGGSWIPDGAVSSTNGQVWLAQRGSVKVDCLFFLTFWDFLLGARGNWGGGSSYVTGWKPVLRAEKLVVAHATADREHLRRGAADFETGNRLAIFDV